MGNAELSVLVNIRHIYANCCYLCYFTAFTITTQAYLHIRIPKKDQPSQAITTVPPVETTSWYPYKEAWKYWPYSRLYWNRTLRNRNIGKLVTWQVYNITAFDVVRQELYGNKSGKVYLHPIRFKFVSNEELKWSTYFSSTGKLHTIMTRWYFGIAASFFGVILLVAMVGKCEILLVGKTQYLIPKVYVCI